MADRQKYENMSRDELVQIIGIDVDADTPRETLITMAIQRDSEQNA